jgi:uncharacterized protein with FMN-binding domain
MRRIAIFLTATVAMVVLLFSYRTSRGGPLTPALPSVNEPAPTDAAPPADGAQTVRGPVVPTVWGPVQVQLSVNSGRITDVVALQYPQGNRRDQQINSYALPELRAEVLAAQSASIDGVSGATVTSDGYRQSVQAAIDSAHLR